MLRFLPRWGEVLFPGFLPTLLGLAGAVVAARRRRELAWLYGGLALLALWASFGPPAGLYAVFYRALPLFAWLRAPARFGLLVDFGVAVLAGIAVAEWLSGVRSRDVAGAVVAAAVAAELASPSPLREAPAFEPVYQALAALPRAPVIELPFFYPQVGLYRHTEYMLSSTTHWMPLVNGYSDYIPPDFSEHVMTLAPFPSRPALALLEPVKVRYAVFHMYAYNDENRRDVLTRLKELEAHFRLVYMDDFARLYEIVSVPN